MRLLGLVTVAVCVGVVSYALWVIVRDQVMDQRWWRTGGPWRNAERN